MDPSSGKLQITELQTPDTDPPINETALSSDVKETVTKLRGRKELACVTLVRRCSKLWVKAMIHGFAVVLTAVCHSSTVPTDWKQGLVVPIWKGKGDRQDCNNYRGITLLSMPGKVLAYLRMMRIRSLLLNHKRQET